MPKTTTLLDKVDSARRAMGEGDQSVQQLAKDAGLQQTPLTAYGTGMIGGSPQQAKMAGVPAQKKAALAPMQVAAPKGETALEQEQKLGTATATAEEENKKRLAGQYAQSLGTYGAKVTEWIDAAKKQVFQGSAELQVDASDTLLAGLDAGKKTEATDILKKIATETDPNKKMQLELNLNNVLGKDVNTVLSPEAKAKMYQDVASSIQAAITAGQTAVTGADRKITLSDINTLGTTPEELAALLKVPVADINNYSLSQLQNKIAEVSQQEFGAAQAAQAGMAAGALSSTDRAALRQYLRGIESTGVAGAEAAVADLARQIDQSQQVQFAGKSFTVDELLASPELNDLFKTVMDEMSSSKGTGPNTEALKQNEPALYDWLTKNRSSVQGLIDQSVGATKAFGELQKANVAAMGAVAQYQPELAKDLGVDPNALRAEKVDPAKLPGVFQAVASLPPEQRQNAAGTLAQLSKAAGADAMKGLSADQVKALQPGVVGGPADVYLKTVDAVKAAQNHTYIEDVIKDFSAGDESLAQLNDVYKDDALAEALGIPRSNIAELDTNQDGKIDQADTAGIKSKISANLPSLDKIAAGQRPTSTLNSFTVKPAQGSGPNQVAFNTISSAIKDGQLDGNEVNAIKNLPISLDDLTNLTKRDFSKVKGGDAIRATLQDAVNNKVTQTVSDRLQSLSISPSIANDIRNINIPEPSNLKDENQWAGINEAMTNANNKLGELGRAISSESNPAVRQRMQDTYNTLQGAIADRQTKIDAFNAEFSKEDYLSGGRGGLGSRISQAGKDIGGTVSTGFKRLTGRGRL